jgi:putative two-component system response regulator
MGAFEGSHLRKDNIMEEKVAAHKALVVEDDKQYINLLANLLKMEEIDAVSASTVSDAINLIDENGHIDILIVDFKLQDGTGDEVVKYAKEHRLTMPAVMISGLPEDEVKYPAYLAGTNVILWKPIKEAEFLMIVKNLINMSDAYIKLEGARTVITALTLALEARDSYTQGHGQRVADLSVAMYDSLGLNNKEERQALYVGALLHDIGKIGVPDGTLKSKTELSPDERLMVNTHPSVGYDICKNLEGIKASLDVIKYHHERLNGTGYPEGIQDGDIPILAQIVAIPDIYDACTTKRTYRKTLSHKQAMKILEKEVKDGGLNEGFFAVFKSIIEKSKTS